MKLNLKIVAATAAVAMMSSGAAHAAATVTVTGAPVTYSLEGLQLSGTNAVTLPPIVITLGNNLTYQDDVYITLPGVVPVTPVVTPTLVTCTISGSAMGYVQNVNSGWNFRVTSVTGIVFGDVCTFTGLAVQGASLASNGGVVNYVANRFITGTTVDSASSSVALLVKSQFGISGNGVPTTTGYIPLNGEIDVYAGRVQFSTAEAAGSGAGAAVPVRADTLAFVTTVDGNATVFYAGSPVVTTTAQVVTIDNGSFDWTDTASPAGVCFDSGLIGFTGWSVATTSTCNSLVLNGPVTNTTNDGYFYVPGTKILSPADWAGKVKFTYSLGSVSASKELTWDPGVWTINGAQVYIQYMPYGTGISRIVYVANSGIINADGTLDVIANGSTTTCNLGAVASKTVTQLSAIVDACVAGAGIASGRVALLMTFTAPDTDVEVYSAYNVGGNDRGTVVNTSNGRGLTYFSKVD
jgi:hypothetical protein